jgi:hypothetical protein
MNTIRTRRKYRTLLNGQVLTSRQGPPHIISLDDKMTILRKAAEVRGLRIEATPILTKTPYRAMNPASAGEHGLENWPVDVIGYDPRGYAPFTRHSQETKAEDLHHEILEYDKRKEGWPYKRAHKFAEREQNHMGFPDLVRLLNGHRNHKVGKSGEK